MHSSQRAKSYSNLIFTNLNWEWQLLMIFLPVNFICPPREVDQGEVCLIPGIRLILISLPVVWMFEHYPDFSRNSNQDSSTRQKKQQSPCNSNNLDASKQRCYVQYQTQWPWKHMEVCGGGSSFHVRVISTCAGVFVSICPTHMVVWVCALPFSCNNEFLLLLPC